MLLLFALLAPLLCAQPTLDRSNVAGILGFEADPVAGSPGRWGGGPRPTLFADEKVVHGGKRSLRIERGADNAQPFSTATASIPIDFSGSTIELRGYIRLENVEQWAGLWMREDGETPSLAFDNMQSRKLHGSSEWTEYSIKLPLHPDANKLFFGFLLSGPGKAWADDLQLLVDGKPIAEAPAMRRPQTVLTTDFEFNGGSRIKLSNLSDAQVGNLANLAKVWGFLKYHHPRIRKGELHWDYELFRVMPKILAAADRNGGNQLLERWVGSLGPVPACSPCVQLSTGGIHIKPDIGWLSDDTLLGKPLSARLTSIYQNRPATEAQFYVKPGYVKNPDFQHELAYANLLYPDSGYQLLALFRFWNMVEYWFPYRDVIGTKWDDVLLRHIRSLALAADRDQYQLALIALIAEVHDTHANLWSGLQARPPQGFCMPAVTTRFVEGKAMVTSAGAGLRAGDVVESINGVPVRELVEQWKPYYAASNEPTQLRDIGPNLLRGPCGTPIKLRREGDNADLIIDNSAYPKQESARRWHDLPGDGFRLLSKDVAYLKMSGVKMEEAPSYSERAQGTKGLIIDLRNYPSAFLLHRLAGMFVERATQFTAITRADYTNPGAFYWTASDSIQPSQPHYAGKVVILVDEVTQSSAEYHTMAFRATPNAMVIGSTTAGADGNVSAIPLPGGMRSMFSGIGIFYPDQRPTQRTGVAIDIVRQPTIAGLRAGRDEVLEEAIRQIVGPQVPLSEIQKLIPARTP